jgi:hypothetical protein
MLKLAKEKGMEKVKANTYSFNEQRRRMFEAAGFQKTDEEWYEFHVSGKTTVARYSSESALCRSCE